MPDSSINIRLCSELDWPEVVQLGNQFKKYLGLYPEKAILKSIHDSNVLGAFADNRLIGYTLFDLPYSDIRLVHLCVHEEFRGRGVARMLTDSIQERYGDREGIRLKCRRDFPAHDVWPGLGFRAQSLTSGRGRDQAEMTVWWRSFGHPDLFAAAREVGARVQAVLDTNVVLDIVLGRDPLTKEYCDAPALDGEVLYCITRSVQNELVQIPDAADRQSVMASLAKYERLDDDLILTDKLCGNMVNALDPEDLERDPSLAADVRVLCETISAGASVMITNDDNAALVLRPHAKLHGVDIIHPSQLVVMVEDLKGIRRDAPDRIQNTSITIKSAAAGLDREIGHLVSTRRGETKTEFLKLIRGTAHLNVRVINTTDGDVVDGVLVTENCGDCLLVRIIRIRSFPLATTLLKQLLFQLRQEALRLGALRVSVTDANASGSELTDSAFVSEGFKRVNDKWVAEVVDARLPLATLRSDASRDLTSWTSEVDGSIGSLAQLERKLWPLKVVDAPLPCYVVPIKQTYASELLGYDLPLLARHDSLGISRRHVYYKSPRYVPRAPGRILWYVSGRRGGMIVGASQLISTHRASVRSLHARFKKYGIWTLEDVEKSASKSGIAGALRFGDTEIFHKPVSLSRAEQIVAAYGHKLGSMPTIREISREAYFEIYTSGIA